MFGHELILFADFGEWSVECMENEFNFFAELLVAVAHFFGVSIYAGVLTSFEVLELGVEFVFGYHLGF